MGELKKGEVRKKSWFKGLKAEFNKIVWPNKLTLAKESTAVIVVAVLLGIIISIVDFVVLYGIELITK